MTELTPIQAELCERSETDYSDLKELRHHRELVGAPLGKEHHQEYPEGREASQ